MSEEWYKVVRHTYYKDKTAYACENILNLGKRHYPGVGKYGIPQIKPITELPPVDEWIGFNEVLSDRHPQTKGVHFFLHDYQFERIWNTPEKYIDKLRQYAVVASPDFSPYPDMPMVLQIYNHYRKHWVGAYLQEHGINVIPTIRANTDPKSLDWYLDGEPSGGIVLISSMWSGNSDYADAAKEEYRRMQDVLKPICVYIYGNQKQSENMGVRETDNVKFIKTFAERRFRGNG